MRPQGFVAAGGASRRMGRDKALLAWGAGTLLDHAVHRLAEAGTMVRILCGPDARYVDHRVPVLPDSLPGQGPLGALLTALLAVEEEPVLLLGIDVPFVSVPVLRFLLELAPGHDVVVPVTTAGPQPLCAVYHRSCLAAVQQSLSRGDRRMTAFWPQVRVRTVAEELSRFGPPDDLFRNLNTPEEYERWRP